MSSTARAPLRVLPLPKPGRRVIERRKQRAPGSADALELALTSAAESGLDVVLIADDQGMLVCHGQTELDLEMLAAVTPIIARGKAKASIKRNGSERELTVKTIKVSDETLHIAALGGDSSTRALGLMRSVAAARRILA